MSNPPNQPPQSRKAKKAAQAAAAQEALVSPPWYPDARWHLRTLALIYGSLILAYYGISALLMRLPKPYQLRDIPPEMTPWLKKGEERHLPEEKLKAPEPGPAKPAAGL